MNYVDDLFPLMPELILSALVLVVITADLFLRRDQKWLLTPLTVFGLDPGRHHPADRLEHQRHRTGRLLSSRRPLGLPQGRDRGHRHPVRPLRAVVPASKAPTSGRVQRDPAVQPARDVRPLVGERPHHPVPGSRADGDAVLRDGRVPQDRSVQQRGRAQVLPARVFRQRHPPVRHQLDLWADREHAPGRDRQGPARRAARRPVCWWRSAS